MRESYQYLEFEHIYSATLGNGLRSLAISACNPGEGCTTLASALAKRHAAIGRKVLLVDFNLYRPGLANRFSLPNNEWQPGQNALPLMHKLNDCMTILTATTKPALLLRNVDTLREHIAQWNLHFDAIIFDTSPLNAINYSNLPAEHVCAAAEACIMVILATRTREEDLHSAREKLVKMQANLLGAVMNDLYNPSLQEEILREINRLNKRMPRLTRFLTTKVQNQRFLRMG